MDINNNIFNLVKSLTNTEEFLEMKNAKKSISPNSKESAALKQFEQMHEQLNNKNLSEAQMKGLMNRLNEEYENMMKMPGLKQYFSAQNKFNKLLDYVWANINLNIKSNLK